MSIFKKARLVFKYILKLSLWNTLRINFRFLPYRQALKLPIFIFKHSELHIGKNAQLHFVCPLQTGMVKLGACDIRWLPKGSRNYFSFDGRIIINGTNVKVGYNSKIILAQNATIWFGGENFINHDNQLLVHCKLSLAFGTSIGWNCQLCDTAFHYIIVDGKVSRKTKPIYIGRESWVGSYCIVGPGAFLPDYSILAQCTLLNKDFSKDGKHLLLGGIPAKIIRRGAMRIMESIHPKISNAIDDFFENNPDIVTINIASIINNESQEQTHIGDSPNINSFFHNNNK